MQTLLILFLAPVAFGRCFNAASKKENNTEGISIHFLIKRCLQTTPSPLTANNIDEKNLQLLLVTTVVKLVLYLDP